MNIEESFKSSYRCEVLLELPNRDVERWYFPACSPIGGSDGVIVDIFPERGNEWLGIFAFGTISGLAPSGLYSCPHNSSLCVVAAGAAYVVDVYRPDKAMKVHIPFICGVTPVAAKGLLLFHDFISIIALGEQGIAWESKRLAWDDLRITEVTDETVSGYGWDAPTGKEVPFEVRLDTGEVTRNQPYEEIIMQRETPRQRLTILDYVMGAVVFLLVLCVGVGVIFALHDAWLLSPVGLLLVLVLDVLWLVRMKFFSSRSLESKFFLTVIVLALSAAFPVAKLLILAFRDMWG